MSDGDHSQFHLRDLAVYLPLMVACAFVTSVSYLFGELLAAGATAVLGLFTFADYVNQTVPVFSKLLFFVFLMVIAIGLLWPTGLTDLIHAARYGLAKPKFKPPKPSRKRIALFVASLVALVAIQYTTKSPPLIAIVMTLAVVGNMLGMLALLAYVGRPFFSDKIVGAVITSGLLVITGTAIGIIDVWGNVRCDIRITITGKPAELPLRVFYLERGIALIWPGKFKLVDWADAKELSVEDISNNPRCIATFQS